MAKVGLFYGSNTGNTEFVAFQMKDEFEKIRPGVIEVHNIGQSSVETMMKYDFLVFGIPTWNTGQMQDDWEAWLPNFKTMDMKGKKVAIFGLGDQNGYGYNFLDAVGMLGDAVLERNADLWGMWSVKGYEFAESKAKVEDHFMGMGVDQEGQKELTSPRITTWVKQIVDEFGL
jgi:flavodoxin I